ncbi:MAG: GTP pyrophosphokinase [Clostridiales bacterium]|nr:GTP pyrophosphokinase [Clostridiales bacterium]
MKHDMIKLAYEVAARAHKDQLDKSGAPYIDHPAMVMHMVRGKNNKVVALLHDTVEDTDVTITKLAQLGFPDKIISAVDAITKRKGEPEEDYIVRVKGNKIALTVKIADLEHNADLTRISNPTGKDFERAKRYNVLKAQLIGSMSKYKLTSPFGGNKIAAEAQRGFLTQDSASRPTGSFGGMDS